MDQAIGEDITGMVAIITEAIEDITVIKEWDSEWEFIITME